MRILEITRADYHTKYRQELLELIPYYSKTANVPEEKIIDSFDEAARSGDMKFWLVFSGEELAGFCLISFYSEIGEASLEQICIMPQFNRSPDRRKVFAELERECKEFGIKRIYAISHKDFGCAKKFERYIDIFWNGAKPAGHLFCKEI